MTTPVEPVGTPTPEADDVDESTLDPRAREALGKAHREARNLRTRLRESEADRERLISQLGASQRRDVERIAGELLIDPTDVWRAASDPQSFVDDEFNEIVADKVVESAKELIQQKPHLAKPQSSPPPTDRPIEGLRLGASPESKPVASSWAQALRGA